MQIKVNYPQFAYVSRTDIGAACTQSADIARKDRMPNIEDRMREAAKEVEAADLVIMGGTVTIDPEDMDTVIVTHRRNGRVYRITTIQDEPLRNGIIEF